MDPQENPPPKAANIIVSPFLNKCSKSLRTKGKAAVDVISPKIGKSASGLVQSVIFTILPTATYNSISSSLMVIFIVVCLLWIYSVRKIYFEYQKIV
ncbi:MAG: hypothetical protein EBY20_12030 [Alphaproteobacteria bacterium]|nr:hypothetical protein [Alphaproteobacteria bacterium]